MSVWSRLGALRARVGALFVEREIYLRAEGRVRFVRITRALQLRVATSVGVVLAGWAVATLVMLGLQLQKSNREGDLTRAEAAVARDRAAVAAFRKGSGGMVDDLQRRQQLMEALVTTRLGPAPGATPTPAPTKPVQTSGLPDGRLLAQLVEAQDATANRIAATFDVRSEAATRTLRELGLNPAAMTAGGRGGPLLPWPPGQHGGGMGSALPPALQHLALAVERWSVLQDNLIALPSTKPTDGTMVTSSYGVRADPFTGAAAFHAGLDFTGAYGSAIRAAAAGTVAFVGQRSGYGNVVEIDHGNGLLTRYAHLSGFDTRPGAQVARGQPIARMGSTGRSTGTHLHFEVRVDGNPVNPRRFLEAPQEIALVR